MNSFKYQLNSICDRSYSLKSFAKRSQAITPWNICTWYLKVTFHAIIFHQHLLWWVKHNHNNQKLWSWQQNPNCDILWFTFHQNQSEQIFTPNSIQHSSTTQAWTFLKRDTEPAWRHSEKKTKLMTRYRGVIKEFKTFIMHTVRSPGNELKYGLFADWSFIFEILSLFIIHDVAEHNAVLCNIYRHGFDLYW